MSKARKTSSQAPIGKPARKWLLLAVAAGILGAIVIVVLIESRSHPAKSTGTGTAQDVSPRNPNSHPAAAPNQDTATPANPGDSSAKIETMETAQAVMVTVELDFGPRIPTIAEALKEIDRGYRPDDGAGRTFAILDAYGDPTPDGKLHMSMHVSSEKPGLASLTFRRTGQVLWQSRIVQRTSPPPQEKRLTILMDNGGGRSLTIDGSTNPPSILAASVKELGVPVESIWQDGQVREITFVYSACGCPVKAMVKRVGDRTTRTTDTPVMFPDDPAAMVIISHLMRW